MMVSNQSPSPDHEGRVVRLHRRPAETRPPVAGPTPVRDLAEYERGRSGPEHEKDEYRHRMIVNGAAFLVVLALIIAGYWLADTMARMRKNQDCVLSGRRGCTPVEFGTDRW
jgi:hypothetical protein